MKAFEHLGLTSSLARCTLALALAGCASGQAFGPRAVAPLPTVQAEPLPTPPPPPPVHNAPRDVDEPEEALAFVEPALLEAMPEEDVALLDRELSNDLGSEFHLAQHVPVTPPVHCVAGGDASLGCAAPPALGPVPSDSASAEQE